MLQEVSVLKKINPFLFRHHIVLGNLPPSVAESVLAVSEIKHFASDEMLFRQGSFAKGAFLLRSGLVKIAHRTPQGQRQVVYVYAPGEWFGYRQLMSNDAYPIGARTVGAVETAFIPAEHFRRLIREQPLFAANLLEALSQEFSVWVNRLTVFNRFPVREKLAICLLFLCERYSKLENQTGNEILFSRTDLADFIGATLETTVRTLSDFKSQGLLTTSGKRISLLSPEGLAKLVSEI